MQLSNAYIPSLELNTKIVKAECPTRQVCARHPSPKILSLRDNDTLSKLQCQSAGGGTRCRQTQGLILVAHSSSWCGSVLRAYLVVPWLGWCRRYSFSESFPLQLSDTVVALKFVSHITRIRHLTEMYLLTSCPGTRLIQS